MEDKKMTNQIAGPEKTAGPGENPLCTGEHRDVWPRRGEDIVSVNVHGDK